MEKGDFLLIELEGRDEHGNVFDSTKGEIAKRLRGKEGPILIILGETPIIKGLEEELYRMKEGEEREIIVPPKKGFGEKKRENIIVFPLSSFKQVPQKGAVLQIETETGPVLGVVTSVLSGRVMVDTNHPLAGKTLYFKIKIVKHLKEDKEKAEALLKENVKDFEIKGKDIIIKDDLKEEHLSLLDSLLKRFGLNFNLKLAKEAKEEKKE